MTSVRPAEHPQDPLYQVVVEEHLVMTARDGTALVADVFRPDAPGRHPTLVMRTPYGRRHRGQLAQNSEVTFYPQRGYVVVIQDVRGRGESQGRYRPFAEGPDTYDAIEWAASLPWSDGNVGMVGQSYLASAQYAAAPLRPPSLRVMSPVAGAANHHLNSIFRTGVFELRWRLAYFTAMERATYARALAKLSATKSSSTRAAAPSLRTRYAASTSTGLPFSSGRRSKRSVSCSITTSADAHRLARSFPARTWSAGAARPCSPTPSPGGARSGGA